MTKVKERKTKREREREKEILSDFFGALLELGHVHLKILFPGGVNMAHLDLPFLDAEVGVVETLP